MCGIDVCYLIIMLILCVFNNDSEHICIRITATFFIIDITVM